MDSGLGRGAEPRVQAAGENTDMDVTLRLEQTRGNTGAKTALADYDHFPIRTYGAGPFQYPVKGMIKGTFYFKSFKFSRATHIKNSGRVWAGQARAQARGGNIR